MLGFAMRKGSVTIGTEMVVRSLSAKGKAHARVALIAADASSATKDLVKKKCLYYGVPVYEVSVDMSELGRLLGKLYSPAAVSVTDDGFAKEIIRALESFGQNSEQRDSTIQRKEVSVLETGDTYASNASENNSNF